MGREGEGERKGEGGKGKGRVRGKGKGRVRGNGVFRGLMVYYMEEMACNWAFNMFFPLFLSFVRCIYIHFGSFLSFIYLFIYF